MSTRTLIGPTIAAVILLLILFLVQRLGLSTRSMLGLLLLWMAGVLVFFRAADGHAPMPSLLSLQRIPHLARLWFVWVGLLTALLAACTLPPPPPIPTPTPTTGVDQARAALVRYYEALVRGDFAQAAQLLDPEADLDPEALQTVWEQMAAQGWRIRDFQVGDARVVDDDRVVFTVTYTQEGTAPEAGPPGTYTVPAVMHRGVDGVWRFAGGVLERRPLFGGPVTQAGLTVWPHLWTVGPAGIEVVVRLSNRGDETLTWQMDGGDCARLRLADGQELTAPCPQPAPTLAPGEERDVTLFFQVDVLGLARPPQPQRLVLEGIQGPEGPLPPVQVTLR